MIHFHFHTHYNLFFKFDPTVFGLDLQLQYDRNKLLFQYIMSFLNNPSETEKGTHFNEI